MLGQSTLISYHTEANGYIFLPWVYNYTNLMKLKGLGNSNRMFSLKELNENISNVCTQSPFPLLARYYLIVRCKFTSMLFVAHSSDLRTYGHLFQDLKYFVISSFFETNKGQTNVNVSTVRQMKLLSNMKICFIINSCFLARLAFGSLM